MGKLTPVVVVCIAIMMAGCGGQQQASAQPEAAVRPDAPPAAAQEQSSPSSQPPYVVSRNGCTINLKKLCQGFIDQPTFVYQGVQYDWNSWTQNNPAHSELRIPVTLPSGESLGMVNCFISNQNHKATNASLYRGGTISEKAIDEVKGKGWCEESSPDYVKMWGEIENRVTPH